MNKWDYADNGLQDDWIFFHRSPHRASPQVRAALEIPRQVLIALKIAGFIEFVLP